MTEQATRPTNCGTNFCSCIECPFPAAMPTQIDAEISRLRKQVRAYQTMDDRRDARIATLQAGRAEWQEAVNALSSEREANAVLTREIGALRLTLAQQENDLDLSPTDFDKSKIETWSTNIGGLAQPVAMQQAMSTIEILSKAASIGGLFDELALNYQTSDILKFAEALGIKPASEGGAA